MLAVNMNNYGLTINPRSKWSESAKAAKVAMRELEILILHSEGKSNEEIAEILDIKYQTVKSMLYSLNKKLEASTNAQAMMKAISEGLIKVNIKNKDERDLADKIMWAIDTELWESDEDAGLINLIKNWRKKRKASRPRQKPLKKQKSKSRKRLRKRKQKKPPPKARRSSPANRCRSGRCRNTMWI